ncbi:MAG: trypsin-like peptidase domain-containing protein, partial [Planctomycetales bacterium]
ASERSVVYLSTHGLVDRESSSLFSNASAHGCGVIIEQDGYILTNFHVVIGATRITVHLPDGRQQLADVVGVDEYTDLAVLKIEAVALPTAKWGDSSKLQRGDPVWAIGSPFGLDNSVTFGIISAKNRTGIGGRSRFQNLLQTDVAVNPGNSGGALVNAQGELVGINTAIVGKAYRGVSFAIPSNMAREVVNRLKNEGHVSRGWLGVRLDKVTEKQATAAGISQNTGTIIVDVVEGSPADAAGFQRDDIIIQWKGDTFQEPQRFSMLVADTEPESDVEAVVIRDGQRVTLQVKVGQLPKTIRQ